MQTLRVGDAVADRYELLRLLGAGSQGSVFLARQQPLGREVALKAVTGVARDDLQSGARFRLEAEALARLAHPCCVRVFDFGVWLGRPYLVMELVTGVPLATALRGTPWPAERALHIGFQIARGLSHAHASGIVHRDLSPANVMLQAEDEEKEGVRVKLVDFGLARFHDDTQVLQSGQTYGTPSYLAPERIRGDPGTPACDVYATGVILHEMLTGKNPLRRTSATATVAAVLEQGMPSLFDADVGHTLPAALCDFVDSCTAQRPEDRLKDGIALRQGLAAVRQSLHDGPRREFPAFDPEMSHQPSVSPDLGDLSGIKTLIPADSASQPPSVQANLPPSQPPAARAPVTRPDPDLGAEDSGPPMLIYAVSGAVAAAFLVVLILGLSRLAGLL